MQQINMPLHINSTKNFIKINCFERVYLTSLMEKMNVFVEGRHVRRALLDDVRNLTVLGTLRNGVQQHIAVGQCVASLKQDVTHNWK